MRIVFDTNVYISAALNGRLSANILVMAAKAEFIEVLYSNEILDELREKLLQKFHWTTTDADMYIQELKQICEDVTTTEEITVMTRDPDDNKILECAVSGKADIIVSMDHDLLILKEFQGIAILHPKTLAWTFPKYFKKIK